MRFIAGIIIGCLITVGAAYVHDTTVPTGPDAAASGRMVNWEVVDQSMRGANEWVRTQWAWINSQFNRAG